MARILEDSGADVGFEDAALAAAIKSKWKPAIKNGNPIPIWVPFEAAFYLNITDDGQPVRRIDRWHWSAMRPDVPLYFGFDWQKQDTDDFPGMDEFVGIEKAPERVKPKSIAYPERARKQGLQGSVWVKVLVDRSGKVAQAIGSQRSRVAIAVSRKVRSGLRLTPSENPECLTISP